MKAGLPSRGTWIGRRKGLIGSPCIWGWSNVQHCLGQAVLWQHCWWGWGQWWGECPGAGWAVSWASTSHASDQQQGPAAPAAVWAELSFATKMALRHLTALQQQWGGDAEGWDGLLTVVPGRRMRINRHKLKPNRFRLELRNNFFPTGTATHWSRFEPQMDKTLSVLVFLAADPGLGRRLG